MEQKKYLKWYHKIGHSSGDFGSNFMFTFVSSFMMIYLTDTVGLNAAVIGMLIMAAKLLECVTGLFFGNLLDNTHSKMGKARPWVFYAAFPMGICQILLFMIPDTWQNLQYVYFFLVYVLLNAVFYTANNISYTTLSVMITRNSSERVQLSSIRMMFAYIAGILISTVTLNLVGDFGGGAAGWRSVAIIYTLIMLFFNSIAVFSAKELPGEAKQAEEENRIDKKDEKLGVIYILKTLFKNKFFWILMLYNALFYASNAIASGTAVYYFLHVIGNPSLMGVCALAGMVPTLIGLVATPFLVSRFGIYKVTVIGMISSAILTIPYAYGSFNANLGLIIIFSILKGLGAAPIMGCNSAITADVAHYTYLKEGVHLEGSIFSVGSIGIKFGSGFGSALCGFLLSIGGYLGTASVQTQDAILTLKLLFGVLPFVFAAAMAVILAMLKVQYANEKLEANCRA